MTAEDQARTEQRRIHEEALVRRHAFWCKSRIGEECTCHEERKLAPRKPKKKFDPNDPDYKMNLGSTDANQTKP